MFLLLYPARLNYETNYFSITPIGGSCQYARLLISLYELMFNWWFVGLKRRMSEKLLASGSIEPTIADPLSDVR